MILLPRNREFSGRVREFCLGTRFWNNIFSAVSWVMGEFDSACENWMGREETDGVDGV